VGDLSLRPIGRVESGLTDTSQAPRQPDEGAPPATVRLEPGFAAGTTGLVVGDRIVVLTWLDRADRDVLTVHPRGDTSRAPAGVFATRSPSRPNPIGLHEVTVTRVGDGVIEVDALEAVDGTPVLDVKPVLVAPPER
jgi:tRNA-Thr(GGU) m(6)t(6)A37 methyltransferase TsaA